MRFLYATIILCHGSSRTKIHMKLVTVLTVQQAQQAFYTARMAQRALRSDTAADRCVNLAVHTSG